MHIDNAGLVLENGQYDIEETIASFIELITIEMLEDSNRGLKDSVNLQRENEIN